MTPTAEMEMLPLPPLELVRAETNGHPVTSIGSNVAAALATARDRCAAVEKGARNAFQKYDYASADAIIGAAKDAMNETGLLVIPLPAELHVSGSGQLAFYEMRRRVVLAHASGESIELPMLHWPVIPEKGRPLDKAFAIAITTSLAYFLRDLLSMTRVDASDDMSGRNDQHAPQPPAGTPPAGTPPTPEGGFVTAEQLLRIQLLARQCDFSVEAVHDRIRQAYRIDDMSHMTPDQATEIETKLQAHFNQLQATPV